MTRIWSVSRGELLHSIPFPNDVDKSLSSIPALYYSEEWGGKGGMPGLLYGAGDSIYVYSYWNCTFRRRESLNKHLPSFGFNGRGTSHHCVNFLDPVSVFLLTKTHTFLCFLTLNRLKRWNWNGCIRRQKFWKTVELKLDAFVRGSL